jgi:hypothetical protein
MQRRSCLLRFAGVLLLRTVAPAPFAAAAGGFDPCSLLSNADIRAVQNTPVASTKSSEPERGRFAVSQCFYTLTPFSKSISLEVTRRRPGEKEGPGSYWKELFAPARWKEKDRDDEKERGSEGEEEREKRSSPPRRIVGVGDDAYWVGPATGGGLFVLTGDAYFRLSLGGSDAEPVKIRKLVKLARAAVKRL